MNRLIFKRHGGYYQYKNHDDARDVYLLSTWPPEFTNPIYKIGFSVNVLERVYFGGTPICANFPFPVHVETAYKTLFYRNVENALHNHFKEHRINMYGGNGGTEWFNFGRKVEDIANQFIGLCVDYEKSIECRRLMATPNIEEIDYTDNFNIIGRWDYWYENHSPAGEAATMYLLIKMFKQLKNKQTIT